MRVLRCNIKSEEIPLESDSFDAVLFFEIFEHLRINPIYTLREVLRVLKPGGLLLATPNLRSLGGIKNFLLRNQAYSCFGNILEEYEKLEQIGHMGHVREYTSTEVIDFLKRLGFDVIKIIYRGKYEFILNKLIISIFPSLRPFITYVAQKAQP